MKILTIIGARPQFIKAATVSRALQKQQGIEEILVHTGQHFDENMSAIFFKELDIQNPTYNLGIGGGTHGQNTGRMIEAIETLLLQEKPEWVLVYGDTDSTLAGALAAAKLHIPIAHVEAGLRSFNRRMPEEVNRVLTDHAANILFTPTTTAVKNLVAEGFSRTMIYNVGDVMYDAVLFYANKAEKTSTILKQLGLTKKQYILVTIHRQENVDSANHLASILQGFEKSNKLILLPLHPRTRDRLKAFGLSLPDTVKAIDPIGYLDMIMLEKHATLIATDSGGIQKEAYFHRVPCITLREETEWVELVDIGANKLVGTDPEKIADALAKSDYNDCFEQKLYGYGNSSTQIVNILVTPIHK